ncbi:MAG: hypothetical protein GXX86_05995 [Propionibacterium sp.]|nr:hypothetical protein [Propionibacterium sp.]
MPVTSASPWGPGRAWRDVRTLPGLSQVLTAGSAHGVTAGLDALRRRAGDPEMARLIMTGDGLRPEHLPGLVAADVRAFTSAHRPVRAAPSGPAWTPRSWPGGGI